jgi:anionic cell wall polymer biosynthesis LytR-Cps2A-Psr (LCP) family protein
LGKMIAGKILYGLVCLAAAVVVVVAGYAHQVVGQTTAIGKGITIAPDGPTVGAMNILVMGLESRTDFDGNTLPNDLLTAMHAGNASSVSAGLVGSQDTNTLILIHIFAGGQKAVGFSIPRDDLVTFPQTYDGQAEGKIDAAYAYAYVQYLNAHTGSEDHDDLYLHANQAGQAATVATVQAVTGQHIDHFAEVNLAGFYYLAEAFGGIEACVKPAPASAEPAGMAAGTNLTDADPQTGTDNSGFSAYKDGYNRAKGGAQYLHLSAPQALAFVRSRDTLPGIDLGRTKRQQATLDYVIFEVKHEGLFSDLGKLDSLLSTATKYLITDNGFQLLDFATDMRALNGQDLAFQTLPFTPENNVPVPGYPGPQDVNIIDVPAIQRLVASAFNPQPVPAPGASVTQATTGTAGPGQVTVDVYNGNPQASGLATEVSTALAALGYPAGKVTNSAAQTQAVLPATQVFYGAGASADADRIAVQFGTMATSLPSLKPGHVEVLLGSTVSVVPAGIATSSPAGTPLAGTQEYAAQVIGARAAASPSATPTASGTGAGSSGTGGSVIVAPNAPYGIPCVY